MKSKKESRVSLERDYSGYATKELAACFYRHLDGQSLDSVAKRVGMDPRDMRRIVALQKHDFVGLHSADRIMMSVGVNVVVAEQDGMLHAIPGRSFKDAMRMAEDEFLTRGEIPEEEEVIKRAKELRVLRNSIMNQEQPLVAANVKGN
jgi:hypothetical protein